MYQESENSSKPEYIFGHLFGGIGVLAGNSKKLFCIPLSLKIHDGIKLNLPQKAKRGRPRKKGATLKLKELFITENEAFTKTTLNLYGKEVEVEYLTKNLLWGQKWYKELRFVLVKYQGINSILVSTKLDLEPTTMISLYASRFKIECTFRELKQVIGGLSYQCWSKVMPRSKRYAKKGDPDPIEKITSESDKKLILAAVKAIEGYVMISNIAIGLLQILSLKFSGKMTNSKFPLRFLRTQTNEFHSEATVACFLRKSIFFVIEQNKKFAISRIIKSKQLDPSMYGNLMAS